jgi:hypothetical protein
MEEGGKVLEIGPGRKRTENRFYVDIRPVGDKGKIAEADATINIPFANESFSKVMSTFPDGSLIRSLTGEKETKVWDEIGRVLTSDGIFEVVTEENYVNPQTGEIAVASAPQKIQEAAKKSGFVADVKRLTRNDLKELETNQPMVMRYMMREDFPNETPFFRITSKKTS